MSTERPDTIVVVNDFAHVQGGASKIALNEAIALAGAGRRVILFAAAGPVSPLLGGTGVEVICLGQPQLQDVMRNPAVAAQGLWNRRAHRAMTDLLRSLDPARTVVHLHGWTKALSASPVSAAAALGFPIICTLHDFFTACPNGAFFDYNQVQPCLRTALSARCIAAQCDKRHRVHKIFRVARQFAWQRFGQLPGAIHDYISLSDRSEAILKPYLPHESRLHRVRHDIDVAHRPAAQVTSDGAIICVGRLDEEKGVRLLAQAAVRVGQAVTFVGEGPLREELAAMPGITITGWLAPADVMAWLDRARLVVFPSLWYETFGLVVEEAASRGVATVASDVSAPSERIEDGVNGWLFESGNVASLEQAMRRALAPGAAARAGASCYRRYWDERARDPAHCEILLRIYGDMLAGKRADAAAHR